MNKFRQEIGEEEGGRGLCVCKEQEFVIEFQFLSFWPSPRGAQVLQETKQVEMG